MNRVDAMAKAREAKAAKKMLRDLNPETGLESINPVIGNAPVDIGEAIAQANLSGLKVSLWREAMVAMMHSGKLNHPVYLQQCSNFADDYTKFAMEKFK